MSSANTVRSSWIAGEKYCLANNGRHSETSAHAVPLRSAHTWSNVTTAHTRSSRTNPVAIGIVQSATAGRATSGSPKRAEEILPVPYCHVVFTLPRELAVLALQNPRVIYGILFRAAAESLLELAADPKRLGARLGLPGRPAHLEANGSNAIPMSTVSCPPADYLPAESDGSLLAKSSSCRWFR